jgi:hypothetical protein
MVTETVSPFAGKTGPGAEIVPVKLIEGVA